LRINSANLAEFVSARSPEIVERGFRGIGLILMNEGDIFLAAAQIAEPQLRAAFLDSVCTSDAEQRHRIEKLLAAYDRWGGAWDKFAVRVEQRLDAYDKQEEGALSADVGDALNRQSMLDVLDKLSAKSVLSSGTAYGRYEILKLIGSGGMGEVYLALDQQLNRKVALKLLPTKQNRNAKWVQRFQQEARAASALNHPNILTIYEVGETERGHYIATEFVDGVTLREAMSKSTLALPQALDYFLQVSSALAAAHTANIVHRDIKPENIMIRIDGIIKVLDFGLAKQIDSDAQLEQARISQRGQRKEYKTAPGAMLGTYRYMSPEQASGFPVDARGDVFCIGIVLFEAITGQVPFDGETSADAIEAVIEHETPPLRQFVSGVPAELERIVRKSLQKNREERYQTARDLYVDLKQFQKDFSGSSKPFEYGARPEIKLATGRTVATAASTDAPTHQTTFMIPEVRYAMSGDVNIAYQVLGQGDLDLVFVMGWVSHLDWFWKEPNFAKFLRRLASFARVILFDKRGTGLSDRVPVEELPTLEQRMDDVRAVMEAVGSERAVLCGVSEGGPMCTLFAATYPERTIALAMIGCYARRLRADDYPWGPSDEQREHFFEEIRNHWGGPVGIEARAPSLADDVDFRNWWATYLRMGASPGAALALTRMNAQIDVRPILATIQVPTIVIHRKGDRCLLVEEGKYLAEQIPGAKFVELPGQDHLPFVGNQDEILDEIEEFLTGVRHTSHVDRVLATVLSAQVIHESRGADKSRDDARLKQHHALVIREIELFKGRTAFSHNDSTLATFDGPARAIRAASAIRDSAHRLGLKLQVGLHTGECDVIEKRVSGVAVDLAQAIALAGSPGDVIVSSTVKDLVAGAGIHFLATDLTPKNIVPGEWRLFRIVR
jgi:serine/threonine protein kinase/pimeloyl-ACP methyl ester carboxylesterase/class 3 adenylate cyclase